MAVAVVIGCSDVVEFEHAGVELRIIMSVSLALPEKSPKPATCHSSPTWPMERRRGDGVIADVVDLEAPVLVLRISMSVSLAIAREIAKARDLPFQPDLAHRRPHVIALLLMS